MTINEKVNLQEELSEVGIVPTVINYPQCLGLSSDNKYHLINIESGNTEEIPRALYNSTSIDWAIIAMRG